MSNIEEDIMSEEAFNELIDNFEIVGTLTEYGRKAIKQNVKNLQKRIQELEEDNKRKDMFVEMAKEVIENSILKQKIKDLLTEIQEEYNKVQEQFDCIWNKKSKDDYDRYKLQEFSTMQQQLGFFIGKLEELLEDK